LVFRRLIILLVIFFLLACSSSDLDNSGKSDIVRVFDNHLRFPRWNLADLSAEDIQNRKLDLDQNLVIAGADNVWRRAVVLSSEKVQEISLDTVSPGKLQFWVCSTKISNNKLDQNPLVSVKAFNHRDKLLQSFQLTIPNGESRWEKHEIQLKKSGRIKCCFALNNKDQKAATEIKVLIGSPVFVPEESNNRPIVIVLVVDSLRARDTGMYGSANANTPFLDEFSRHSIIYSQALSSSSWTMPSVRNLMSGQYSNRFAREGENLYEIREPFPLIQEIFSEGNWYTAAISANNLINVDKGYERGFDVFDSGPSKLWRHGSSREIYRSIKEILTESGDMPLFMYLHIMDPHDPYTPLEPFVRICDPPPDDSVRQILHSKEAGHLNFSKNRLALKDIEREYLHDYYCGEIRQMDTLVHLIFKLLEDMQLLQNSMILFTADHGEEFGEHGYYQHGKTLYEDSVRVPFVIKDFTDKVTVGQIKPGWVSTVDIPETLSKMAGLHFSLKTEGMNIYPPANINLADRTIYTILHHRDKEQNAHTIWRAAYSGTRKIMWMNKIGYRCTDLSKYPADNFDLVSPDYDTVFTNSRFSAWRPVSQSLNEFIEGELVLKDHENKEVDKGLRQKLMQLGYVN